MEVDYKAEVVSPIVNGEAKLKVGENSFTITGLLDVAEISYADMNKLSLEDYVITVVAESGEYVFSKMGEWNQPFFDALCDTYNKAVLRSLFIKERALITAKGLADGQDASIQVFERAVVSLPPNLDAKRVPLCFITGMDKAEVEVTLTLDTGDSYKYSKLGFEMTPFVDAIEKQIKILRDKSIANIMEIDASLSTEQSSALAKIMPEGISASIGDLKAGAESFVTAVEAKIADSRAKETYQVFKELGNPEKIYVGFMKNEVFGDEEAENPDPYIVWMIAPSPDGKRAAVEFAEENTATFVYDTDGDFDKFAKTLNRALEAINFRREVIRLTDEELLKPGNEDYKMASKRNEALKFVRSKFVDRIIHSSMDSWKNNLTKLWGK